MKDERLGLWHMEMHNNVQILVHHSDSLLLCQKSDEPEMAEKIAILLQTLQLFYLLQTLSYWFKIMVDFLYSKVNMKFEVQFQINFVAFFMWHQLGIVPNLKELFLLHIVESVQQLSISIIRYYCNTLCNNYLFQLCFSVAKAALESQMSAFCPSVPKNQNPSATLCFRYSRLLNISACF